MEMKNYMIKVLDKTGKTKEAVVIGALNEECACEHALNCVWYDYATSDNIYTLRKVEAES